MVKNSKGGKGSKRIARKHVVNMSQRIVRYAKEEGEMYAVVSKHFGGQCEVVTSDGVTRLCIVRGKFKGRQRRDNNITLGTWVMVGIRDWEVRGDGKTKCDLLYVYSDLDKDDIKQNTGINFKEMEKINTEITGVTIEDDVVFKDDNSELYYNNETIIEDSEIVDEAENKNVEEKTETSNENTAYEFDIDEI